MMEGISHEACALAGTLQLSKLIAFWDDNGISLDVTSKTGLATTRQRAYRLRWNVIANVDGHDTAAVEAALLMHKIKPNKPTANPH